MANGSSREGKHREEKAMLAGYYTDDIRALCLMVQDAKKTNFTDYLLGHILADAHALGILDEAGKVTPKYKAIHKALTEMCIQKRKEGKRKK